MAGPAVTHTTSRAFIERKSWRKVGEKLDKEEMQACHPFGHEGSKECAFDLPVFDEFSCENGFI